MESARTLIAKINEAVSRFIIDQSNSGQNFRQNYGHRLSDEVRGW